MCLTDTAEYWNDVKTGYTYGGSFFVHAPNVDCGHGHPVEATLLGDVNCPSCIYRLKNGAITTIPEGKPLTKKEKQHLRYLGNQERLYGRCSCGALRTLKTNSLNGQQFLGCTKFPKCRVTSNYKTMSN